LLELYLLQTIMGNTSGTQRSTGNSSNTSNAVVTPTNVDTGDNLLLKMCAVPSYPEFVNKKVGVAVIGVGSRLRSLMSDLLYTHIGLCELKAIADESAVALKKTQDQFREFKFESFSDYNEMLAKVGTDVQWVLIGSKNYLHKDHCLAAFKAGKHVFCENPLAITLEQCEEIHKAHLESGVLFATGFVLRHAPLYVEIRAMANDATKFGKIISAEACENIPPDHGGYIMRNWRRHRAEAGPHILEKCCHDIDILLWTIGSLPVRIAAFGGNNIFVPENAPTVEEEKQRYKWWSDAWEDVDPFTVEKDIEDNLVAILEFNNNVRVTFHANSNSALPQRRISICGTKGAISGDLYAEQYEFSQVDPTVRTILKKIHAVGIHGGGDRLIVDDLAKCMEIHKQPKASGQDALVSAIVCLAIDQARIEGKIVDLLPIWKKFNIDATKSFATDFD